eukprot:7999260-Alexandrium_andersonii.AAC.1
MAGHSCARVGQHSVLLWYQRSSGAHGSGSPAVPLGSQHHCTDLMRHKQSILSSGGVAQVDMPCPGVRRSGSQVVPAG